MSEFELNEILDLFFEADDDVRDCALTFLRESTQPVEFPDPHPQKEA